MTQAACTRIFASIFVMGAAGLSAQSYVPQRVFDSAASQFSDFESMLAAVAKADVIFVGEQHDDPNTHRLERALLDGLARRRGDIVVSLEMFERDVQDRLDQFRSGKMPETDFLASSRPWPRYATDYKALVDLAVERQWPVIAANIPRPIASEISKAGLDVLKSKSETEKTWFARDWQCPTDDEYYRRFKEVMGGHTAASDMDRLRRPVPEGRDDGGVNYSRLVRGCRRETRHPAARGPLQRIVSLRLRPRHGRPRETPNA